jgi:hypothetical protein
MTDTTADEAPAWTADEAAYVQAVADALAELDGVSQQLREWQEAGEDIYSARLALYLRLRDLKVPHRAIAAHTDGSAEAVRVAIFKADHPDRPSRPRKAT